MSVMLRGKSWQAAVPWKGSPRGSVRRQFPTEAEALAWLHDSKARILRGEAPLLGEQAKAEQGLPRTLRELADYVHKLRWYGLKGEKKQMVNVEQVVRAIGPSMDIKRIDRLMASKMVLKFRDQGNSNSTINKKNSALRVMLEEALKLEIIDKVPDIPHYKEVEKRGYRITPEIEEKLLAVLEHMGEFLMRDYVILSLETAMRQGEALKLRWSDVGPNLEHITLYETKGGKNRTVPLAPRVTPRSQEVLKRLRESTSEPADLVLAGLEARKIWEVWNDAKAALGLLDEKAFKPHGLRHECCSRWGTWMPAPVIQKLAGHKNLSTSQGYIHISQDDITNFMKTLQKPDGE
jgi:integrase